MNELTPISPLQEPSNDELSALVRRIVSSRVFQKSARQRDFFLYVAECSVAGRLEDINEQAIGFHVFGRQAGYDTGEDNIVRTAARQLRIKLREYFESEGRAETLTVEIPKGSYVPFFHRRQDAQASPPANQRKTWFRPAWLLAVPLAFALPFAWLWPENRALRKELRSKEPVSSGLVACLKKSSPSRLTVVTEDSTFGTLVNYLGKTISLEDYTARRFPPLPDSGKWAGAQNFFDGLLVRKLTSIADAELAAKIARSAGEHHLDVRLRHARDLIVRDFHSDNLVIIGGPRTNPWTQLLEHTLNFQFEIDPGTNLREIVNKAPKPGESARYSDEGQNRGVSWARVAVVPNLGRNGKVFLIGGTRAAATEAAGDYLLSPSALDNIQKSLQATDLSKLESLELLLEISQLDGTPRQTRLVAWRAGQP